MLKRTQLLTDVLVIGGGAAGVISALKAHELGADVTIICKQKVGKSGNTIVSGSAFSVVVKEESNPDNEEVFYDDLIKSGKGINHPELAKVLATNSSQTIGWLENHGMKFFKKDNEYVKRQPPGHSYPRSVPTEWEGYSYMARGLSFMKPLHLSVLEKKIKILEHSMVYNLVKQNNKVVGAIAIDAKKNELIEIACKAVILANGGAGNMFSQNNNTVGITGDSYALAYEIGAILKDMEFVQFYPTMMIEPIKMPASNPLFGDGAVLRNKRKELFVHNYVEGGDRVATRDKMAQAIFQEVRDGNGVKGGVYFDCSQIPKEVLETKYVHFCRQLRKNKIDPYKDMVIVSPTTHYFLGGIKINSKCESNISGLYAAGEAATGIHGANRLSGCSIADTVVFGIIAGEEAARYSKECKLENIEATCGIGIQNIQKLFQYKNNSHRISEKRELLRDIMWDCASVIREEKKLNEGLFKLLELEKNLDHILIENSKDLVSYRELTNMITVGKLVIQGALKRKESRGSHWRIDFLNEDENYIGNHEYYQEGERLNINFYPI